MRALSWKHSLVLALAMAGSVAWGFGASGCLIPDKCIWVYTSGMDWCSDMVGAQMWPPGEERLDEPVVDENGDFPRGCACFNDAEVETLESEEPADRYAQLAGTIEMAARNDCDFLVPAGWDHNCYDEGPAFIVPLPSGSGSCVGDCSNSCGEDPNPYECNEIINGDGGSEDGGESESGGPQFEPPEGGEILWPR